MMWLGIEKIDVLLPLCIYEAGVLCYNEHCADRA